MRLLILDNYDSFTYNLVHIIDGLNIDFDVFRNDEITPDQASVYDKFLLSPGPGTPNEAGVSKSLISEYYKTKDILGVCLGHQAIAETMGGSLCNLQKVYHGVASKINVLKEDMLFKNIPKSFLAGRYHSWAVKTDDLPEDIEVIAEDEDGLIMAIRHKKFNLRGVQFHPESILTEHGVEIIENFIKN